MIFNFKIECRLDHHSTADRLKTCKDSKKNEQNDLSM